MNLVTKALLSSASLYIILTASTTSAATCTDLSHISKIGASDVHVVQSSCDKWTRQMYFQGQPVGDPQDANFSSTFTVTNVDDQYERYTSHQRWFWASPIQDILIHEYVIDSFDKSTAVATFTSGSESYSVSGNTVLVVGQKLVRTTGADNRVIISSAPSTNSYPRLSHP